MATRLATSVAQAACDAMVDTVDGGSPGYVEVRTGAQPATVATAASGTLLGTLPLANPAFGNATNASPAVATANAVTSDTSADASGTAGWFRVYNSAGTAKWDGSCTGVGGGGEMELDNTSIVLGGVIAVSSFVFRMPTA